MVARRTAHLPSSMTIRKQRSTGTEALNGSDLFNPLNIHKPAHLRDRARVREAVRNCDECSLLSVEAVPQ